MTFPEALDAMKRGFRATLPDELPAGKNMIKMVYSIKNGVLIMEATTRHQTGGLTVTREPAQAIPAQWLLSTQWYVPAPF